MGSTPLTADRREKDEPLVPYEYRVQIPRPTSPEENDSFLRGTLNPVDILQGVNLVFMTTRLLRFFGSR
jgi:hypothetical protein